MWSMVENDSIVKWKTAGSTCERAFPSLPIRSSALVKPTAKATRLFRLDDLFKWKARKSPNKHPLSHTSTWTWTYSRIADIWINARSVWHVFAYPVFINPHISKYNHWVLINWWKYSLNSWRDLKHAQLVRVESKKPSREDSMVEMGHILLPGNHLHDIWLFFG
jgi:hypothetical protein